MTFSLSSTYLPRLTNDVFIQHRAWRLFVLTAVLPAPPTPTGEGVGSKAVSTAAESIGQAAGWPRVLPFG